jgi:hypothetical protein
MTDCRILVPNTDAVRLDDWLSYLNGPKAAAWFDATLKRKGQLLEFYGPALAAIPGPHGEDGRSITA